MKIKQLLALGRLTVNPKQQNLDHGFNYSHYLNETSERFLKEKKPAPLFIVDEKQV